MIRFNLLFLFIFSLSSCGEKFSSEKWVNIDDFTYKQRLPVVRDLMKNHLHNGMKYDEIIQLLGKPEICCDGEKPMIGYTVLVDYGWDIDPVEGKNLIINLSNDSIIMDYSIEEWKN